jgi:phospholipid/cholesterol/gamma-HCH transport system substrate-binding protein
VTRRAQRLVAGIALAAAIVAAVVIITGGGSHYELKMRLANASGVRPGSIVQIGGVKVGNVKDLDIDANKTVVATMEIDDEHTRIGQGVTADIVSSNLLGEKAVSLRAGDQSRPLPSGYMIAPSRVHIPTDLDQIVDVLDPATRVRLGVLINEAGSAFVGRRTDFSAAVRRLGPAADVAHDLLSQLVSDNHTLADVVRKSDGLIADLATHRRDVASIVDSAAGAAETVEARSEGLRASLQRAPAALRTLQTFLGELRDTTVPLKPAAQDITESAAPLRRLLAAVPAFERAAVPTLNRAADVAPTLTTLARKGTPLVRRTTPTVRQLADFAGVARPLTRAAGLSIDDLLGIIWGWSHAIQYRDGLGHIFHAKVALSPQIIYDLARFGGVRPLPNTAKGKADAPKPSTPQQPTILPPKLKLPPIKVPAVKVPDLTKPGAVKQLLDFLLGPKGGGK